MFIRLTPHTYYTYDIFIYMTALSSNIKMASQKILPYFSSSPAKQAVHYLVSLVCVFELVSKACYFIIFFYNISYIWRFGAKTTIHAGKIVIIYVSETHHKYDKYISEYIR